LYLCSVKFDDVTFELKTFSVTDRRCGMKLGTDGMLLGAWTRPPHPAARTVCDAGAGCGIVSLMLAHRFPQLDITAVEIDPGAVADAALNFGRSPWAPRLHSVCADITASAGIAASGQDTARVDMVVSNPPYFLTGERAPRAARATARHAGSLSPDWLVEHAAGLLAPGGSLSLIVPAADEDRLTECAAFARMYPRRICRVSSVEGKAPIRLLCEYRAADGPVETAAVSLRRADGTPTPDYIEMFHDFYLHL